MSSSPPKWACAIAAGTAVASFDWKDGIHDEVLHRRSAPLVFAWACNGEMNITAPASQPVPVPVTSVMCAVSGIVTEPWQPDRCLWQERKSVCMHTTKDHSIQAGW